MIAGRLHFLCTCVLYTHNQLTFSAGDRPIDTLSKQSTYGRVPCWLLSKHTWWPIMPGSRASLGKGVKSLLLGLK